VTSGPLAFSFCPVLWRPRDLTRIENIKDYVSSYTREKSRLVLWRSRTSPVVSVVRLSSVLPYFCTYILYVQADRTRPAGRSLLFVSDLRSVSRLRSPSSLRDVSRLPNVSNLRNLRSLREVSCLPDVSRCAYRAQATTCDLQAPACALLAQGVTGWQGCIPGTRIARYL